MSLLCLVIAGKDNEPLYQRDFLSLEQDEAAVVSDEEGDAFGFASAIRSTKDTISLRHEVSFMKCDSVALILLQSSHTVSCV